MSDLIMLTKQITNDKNPPGLLFHTSIGNYVVELQTSLLPNLLHLVVFDKTSEEVVYQKLGLYEYGERLEDHMDELNAEVQQALASLS